MNFHRDLAASKAEFNSLMHQAELIRAYIDITQKMGPSEQLLAFIDFDKSLEVEIGLESFDNFSLSTKHEIVLSKLNPDALEEMAMESLATRIDKISKWVMASGIAGWIGAVAAINKVTDKTFVKIGALSTVAIYAGYIAYAVNKHINGIFPQAAFYKFERLIEAEINSDLAVLKNIPNDFSLGSWESFHKAIWNKHSEIREAEKQTWDKYWELTKVTRVLGEKSGWTADNFKDSVKKIAALGKSIDESRKPFAAKLAKIEAWLKEHEGSKEKETRRIAKLIDWTVSHLFEEFDEGYDLINWAGEELERASRLFVETDKADKKD